MDDHRIDRLLGTEDSIDPSPGFAAAVMEAVRSEAADCARLRFPWRLTWPALAGVGLCTAMSIPSLFAPTASPITTASGPDIVEQLLGSAVELGTSAATGWVVFSCVFTLLIVQFSMQLVRRASP